MVKNEKNEDLLVGAKAIADYIHISTTTLMERIHYNGFPAFKVGATGVWQAFISKIDLWLDEKAEEFKKEIEEAKEQSEKKRRGRPKKRFRPRDDGF